uniref:hypothetical protein n=1 Tax=Aetokthonos hydrillicola TaxID=1550245 RepID=UPI001ABB3F1D
CFRRCLTLLDCYFLIAISNSSLHEVLTSFKQKSLTEIAKDNKKESGARIQEPEYISHKGTVF